MGNKIKTKKYRPCIVGENKALFHKWAETEDVILKFDMCLTGDNAKRVQKMYMETGCVQNGVRTEKIKRVFGIVEFQDGTIEEVRPTDIRFLDSEEVFLQFDFKKGEDMSEAKYKKWYDICFSADNVASEVLDCEEAKNELTAKDLRSLLHEFGDDQFVTVTNDKRFVNVRRGNKS